ncbi:MAG: hypothetical protein KDD82_02690 [Planctomycetes bacterium]|nr:hypothetical protein [Planctomycetota bacterium]
MSPSPPSQADLAPAPRGDSVWAALLNGAVSLAAPGAVTTLALTFPLLYTGRLAVPLEWSPRAAAYGLLILACGTLSLAAGRQLRRSVTRWLRPRGAFQSRLRRSFRGHGLASALGEGTVGVTTPLSGYTNAGELYRRLWAELRLDPELAPVAPSLARRRALASAYDGFASAFVCWAVVFWVVPNHVSRWPTTGSASMVLGGVCALIAFSLWAEAERSEKEVMRQVVAAHAQRHQPAAGSTPAPRPVEAGAAD